MKTLDELRQARQAAVAEMWREHPHVSFTELDLYEARLHLADIDYLLAHGLRQPRPAFLGIVLAVCFIAAAVAPWVLR